MDLAQGIYDLTNGFPKREEYRLSSQMVRAAISIPANIAEGSMRTTRKDYAYFVSIAQGSTAELETLLLLAGRAKFDSQVSIAGLLKQAEEVGRMLRGLRERLSDKHKSLEPRT